MNQEHSHTSFFQFDVVLVLCVLALMSLGIAFIYSSGVSSDGAQVSNEWIRQIIWSVSGLFLMLVFALVDYRRWKALAIPLYVTIIILLILVLLVGSYIKGARAWLGGGRVGVQPSEFGKLVLILLLARWFDKHKRDSSKIRLWAGALLITILPLLLIILQPDLGTAIVYIPILLSIAFIAGVGWKIMLFLLVVACLTILGLLGYAYSEHIAKSPLAVYRLFSDSIMVRIILLSMVLITSMAALGWFLFRRRSFLGILYGLGILTSSYSAIALVMRILRGYQLMRLAVFLNPQIDPRGAGWHIIQSVTAVGSGGIFGKGFLKGTQSHYQYLPEQSTDFIFSILAEETGFLGALIVFFLFSIVIIRALYIAYTSQDRFGTFVAVGIAALIAFHVIQNVGMAIGVMPITGIPLFFLSYGGSSLWTALITMGLLLSIHSHRYRD